MYSYAYFSSFIKVYVWVFCLHAYLCIMWYMQCPQRPEEGLVSTWIWSYIWCELPRGCWKWNLVRASHWALSSPWMPDFYIYLFARKLIVLACATLFIFLNTFSAAVASPETQIWFSPLHSQAFPFLLCVNHTLFADPLLTGAWRFLGFWHYKDILQ